MKLSKFENVYFKTEGEDIFGSSVLNYLFFTTSLRKLLTLKHRPIVSR